MSSFRTRAEHHLAASLLVALAGCSDGDVLPQLGDTSDTGGEQEPLPGGDDCEPNWYEIDGPPVPIDLDGPDALRSGSLAVHRSTIVFDGPPPPVRTSTPTPIDPVFAKLSFDEFASQYATPYGRDWFVDGDQAMTDAGLHALYDDLHTRASALTKTTAPKASTYTVGGFDAAWSSSRKLSLTWCLGRIMPLLNQELHEEHVTLALATMQWATRAWERTGDVNFIHLAEYDSPESYGSGDCQPGQNGIDFRVRTGPDCLGSCGGKTYSQAIPYNEFIDPENVAGTAEIVLGLQRFFWSENEARINALHELGHVLGYTHEQLQWEDEQDPESENCLLLNDIDWRGVTPPDPDSVMAYDDCVGVNQNLPRLSPMDRLGSYYAYTWGHRRSWMMGAVSQIDDYAYDGLGHTGIVWQKSRSPELELWNSVGEPGTTIEFSTEVLCADGAAPPCVGSFDVDGRVRPVNAFLTGTAQDLDLLFHGPGNGLADSLLVNDGLALDPWNLDLGGFAVPVVGSFTSGISDQILLYRPGGEQDAVLVLDDSGLMFVPMDFPGYAYPLAGRYRGFGGGGNDILWYDPQYNEFTVWQWIAADPYNRVVNQGGDAESLGLADNVEYMPLLGDFNADDMTDIFWYSAGNAEDLMWWSTSNQDAVLFETAATQINGEYRPFVGDFDGNGTSDILWFAAYQEVVRAKSKIWYFSEDESFTSVTLSTHRDYSPYVADFDDDGCSDILWYKPDDPDLESPLWRCVPNQRDFICEAPVTTPVGAYPVGFGGGY